MRIFVALDIDEVIRERIARFIESVRSLAPEARWVRPESLHLTMKFIGEKPAGKVDEIQSALRSISAERFELSFRGYGFFPSEKVARVLWVGMEAEPRLTALAHAVDSALAGLGIAAEKQAFTPHLTLARGAGGLGSPRRLKSDRRNDQFKRLLEKLAASPALEFGKMIAKEFFLYQSELSPGGSRYTKIGRFALTE